MSPFRILYRHLYLLQSADHELLHSLGPRCLLYEPCFYSDKYGISYTTNSISFKFDVYKMTYIATKHKIYNFVDQLNSFRNPCNGLKSITLNFLYTTPFVLHVLIGCSYMTHVLICMTIPKELSCYIGFTVCLAIINVIVIKIAAQSLSCLYQSDYTQVYKVT